MLATSNEEDLPIITIQKRENSKCYAFGGRSVIRYGNIEDFEPFPQLPNTWFLVDSSPTPRLLTARTIFSVSPRTFFYGLNGYQEVMESVIWKYYMAPWELDELKECRNKVRAFKEAFGAEKSCESLLEELYDMVGGVPRYVLEAPMKVLGMGETIEKAKSIAYEHVQQALLIDHDTFELRWASNHIMQKMYDLTDDSVWARMLKLSVNSSRAATKVGMFQAYVQHILREGGRSFKAKSIDDGTEITIEVGRGTKTNFFHTLDEYVKDDMEGSFKEFKELVKTLGDKKWIKSSDEVACIFVVPQGMTECSVNQLYGIEADDVDPTPTSDLKNAKQYILGIDLQDQLRRSRKNDVGGLR
ncbi:hypothetical protein BX616_007798 [Lobosporangium transversale]|nr:hypothetical protein BX616_007798 [Lobosporangium transversale]